jgi:hypothetical protein
MMAEDHPPDPALLAYAAGTLDRAQRAEIAEHILGCARCRTFVRTMEQVGGVVLDDLPPAPLAKESLDRVLAQLDGPAAAHARDGGVARRHGVSVRPPAAVFGWRHVIPLRPFKVGLAAAALIVFALCTYLAADYAYVRYTDDYAASTATTGTVVIGEATPGKIERPGDADWFRVHLTEGATYRFQMEGSDTSQGTLQYPVLRLLDSTGRLLHKDAGSIDEGGAGWTSALAYNAPASGTYFLSCEGHGSDRGTYRVSATLHSAP